MAIELERSLSEPYIPPCWTIDLSLQPRDRYRGLAQNYRDRVHDLTGLFDALLKDVGVPEHRLSAVNKLAKCLLRHVYDKDQTEELRGISEETAVPMYLLVAFNVILDSLMGCTSGGVRTLEQGQLFSNAKMLHFRTLDWEMEPLRKVIVQLDFVRSKSENPTRILASSITYVGFVGVLTGVRQGLSMSLNFRALHNAKTRVAHFRFYLHRLLVLLGRRPSIATLLRSQLVGDAEEIERNITSWRPRKIQTPETVPDLGRVCAEVIPKHTTAAYLIYSDGKETIALDKDFDTARVRRSNTFIATTNHDVQESETGQKEAETVAEDTDTPTNRAVGFNELFDESEDRRLCIENRWTRLKTRKRKGDGALMDAADKITITEREAILWCSKYPTTNECTHYTVVMDPTTGKIPWARAYPRPLTKKAIRNQVLPALSRE